MTVAYIATRAIRWTDPAGYRRTALRGEVVYLPRDVAEGLLADGLVERAPSAAERRAAVAARNREAETAIARQDAERRRLEAVGRAQAAQDRARHRDDLAEFEVVNGPVYEAPPGDGGRPRGGTW